MITMGNSTMPLGLRQTQSKRQVNAQQQCSLYYNLFFFITHPKIACSKSRISQSVAFPYSGGT